MTSRDEDKKKRANEIDDSERSSKSGGDSEPEMTRVDPQALVRHLLNEFPNAGSDLKQLLQVIDGGKAVDINGIPQNSLIMHLRNLFLSLNLKELNHGAFVLPSNVRPTLDVIGSISLHSFAAPERRPIGPETPSAELLAAAAKLTEAEAEAELREAELEQDYGIFIGPPPRPVVAAEAESANQADRFQEKRYWKLSLLVYPDKCAHPQANQAFVKLNKAFKELQDPEKRRALNEKIELKETHERFFIELRAMREAAQWRKLQGISVEGDEELLAADIGGGKAARKREEWMTKLPPERKHEKEEDWVGKHPWKPWDREKDLAGGRQSVKLDSENMTQGLTSRFSGGSYQRNFL
ncbi:hypothetical protein M0R45_029886 [Rubus argutus]|uniref:J domain-containing protein n=1 Tax=Rubus argutus TaxID=59490 RepID=A0AAW1WDA3_RUBAR